MKARHYMKNLLFKEFVLATPALSYAFFAFTLMTFLPGYPILCGAFFVCFGLFQAYQLSREDHDILYSVLLPVAKEDVVLAKYAAAVLLQLAAFVLCAVFTAVRMLWLCHAAAYQNNALLNANPVYLAFVLLIFALFNCVFLCCFFKTAHKIARPFFCFAAASFLLIIVAEVLPHLPALTWMGAGDGSFLPQQLTVLLCAAVVYTVATAAACKVSQRRFARLDL